MTRARLLSLTLIVAGMIVVRASSGTAPQASGSNRSGVVHVAPPTGTIDADRASIVAAIAQGQPDDTIQFARGLYLVGELIPVSTPRLTLLGHPDGTTLRGCDPARAEAADRDLGRAMQAGDTAAITAIVSGCGMFQLTGARTAVRNLVFEHTRLGLMLGAPEGPGIAGGGGHLIEGNTFRNSSNGIRADLASADPTVIRRNRFTNVYHAVSAAANHLQVLENDISAPEPARVPSLGHPSFAIALGGSRNPLSPPAVRLCEYNTIAGNRVEGHPDGILFLASAGTACRHNVIRANTIIVRRVRFRAVRPVPNVPTMGSETDSTVVGVPLALDSWPRTDGVFEDNLIEGNHVIGADGIGMLIHRASRNRIVNNTITGIARRDPFPGNTLALPPARWRDANGAGIWLSSGSNGNEIAGNTFENIASHAIVLEGDSNRVELRSAGDSVRDSGHGNRVTARDASAPPGVVTVVKDGRLYDPGVIYRAFGIRP
jgi:parallel beta-helix repeat protein